MSPTAQRCPRCGATVVGAAAWCTLCYADLRPPPAQPAEPVLARTRAPGRHAAPAADPTPTPEDAADAGPIDGPIDGTAPGLSDEAIEAMIAELAAQVGAEPVPLAGLMRRFSSPGAKAGLMVGGSLLLGAVIVGLLALFGALTG